MGAGDSCKMNDKNATQQDGRHEQEGKKRQQALNGWVRYSSLGLEMAAMVAACVLGGVQLDKRTSMRFPLWTIIGCFLGLAIGMARLIYASRQ